MESIPHQMLEGMLIAAYATGATKLFIYCRAEYPLAIKHLKIAIEQIYENKLNVIDNKTLEINIKEGAGAFVCGEETSLIASLEGKRGTPRFRPPFPTDSGYKGYPTMINNVETYGNVPLIMRMGGSEYAKIGTDGSKGTKLFALAGDLKYPGLVEVPMGTTLRDIVFKIGGADPAVVKAVQTGGPSGGCIPVELFDTPVDYDSLKSLGAIMGSGGMIVIGKDRCMVETARYFLDFTHRESCGKCTFCRVGTMRMFETLEKIVAGNGTLEDLDFLEDLGKKVKAGALCGLGQTAPNPVLATLRYYRNEYIDHVEKKTCTALQCNNLVKLKINMDKCVKCKLCIKSCPVEAITPEFEILSDKCTRCNSCLDACPKKAITRIPREDN
jgi:NADH-quinone oxidoreductase subunit F